MKGGSHASSSLFRGPACCCSTRWSHRRTDASGTEADRARALLGTRVLEAPVHAWYSRAATAGLALGAGLVQPAGAFSPLRPIFENADPRPISGGTDLYDLLGLGSGPLFHFFFTAFRQEVSTMTDFVGHVGAAEVQGTGTLTNTTSHETSTLTFDADMRFMDGLYVVEDGRPRQGTFGFI